MNNAYGTEVSSEVGPYDSMSAIRDANKKIGHSWFGADEIKFFSTTFPDSEYGVHGGRFFIASRKFKSMYGKEFDGERE